MPEPRRGVTQRISGTGVSSPYAASCMNYDDCGDRDKQRSPHEIAAEVRAEVLRRHPDLADRIAQEEAKEGGHA